MVSFGFLPLRGPTFRPLLNEVAECAVDSATMGLQVLLKLSYNLDCITQP